MNAPSSMNVSAPDEQQQVARFLKLLNSLGEHAVSALGQKGVLLEDEQYKNYRRQLDDEKIKETIINTLLRESENHTNQETFCLVAMLLYQLSHEAVQMFIDLTNQALGRNGSGSGIIAMSYHMALIDRATVYLNLPSINDKGYWRLATLSKPPLQPQVVNPATVDAPPPPVLNPTVRTPTEAAPKLTDAKTKDVKRAAATEKNCVENPPVSSHPKEKERDKSKPEGPIKAMLRRITEEIGDNSYEAVLAAIKDSAFMGDLYNTSDNPISVKIVDINTKERTIYLIKQKLGKAEPVTFRLIRKLLSEL